MEAGSRRFLQSPDKDGAMNTTTQQIKPGTMFTLRNTDYRVASRNGFDKWSCEVLRGPLAGNKQPVFSRDIQDAISSRQT
jgi:hypothetical protein